MFTLLCCNFSKSQGGKIQTKNNQLFSWLKKEGKTEASACLIDWPVGPVSARLNISSDTSCCYIYQRKNNIFIRKKYCVYVSDKSGQFQDG